MHEFTRNSIIIGDCQNLKLHLRDESMVFSLPVIIVICLCTTLKDIVVQGSLNQAKWSTFLHW
jgi:hypothetical protein